MFWGRDTIAFLQVSRHFVIVTLLEILSKNFVGERRIRGSISTYISYRTKSPYTRVRVCVGVAGYLVL